MRVLQVIWHLGLGGAQVLLLHLWPAFRAAARCDVEFCAIGAAGHFGAVLREDGARVHELEVPRRSLPVAVARLRRLIKTGRYDVVHAHLFPELIVAPLAAAGRGCRLVYTEHAAWNRRRRLGALGRAVDLAAYRRFDRIVAVDPTTAAELQRWLPSLAPKLIVVPNGVCVPDTSRRFRASTPTDREPLRLLFAGRLTHQKGLDVLLPALARVEAPWTCRIAGTGPAEGDLRELARALRIDGRVSFLGFRSDVQDLLMRSDAMVLPSRWEGMPIVVLEALAACCPVIATEVDGTARVLTDGCTGLLVPPENPTALAAAIEKLAADPALAERMARAGRTVAVCHSSAATAQALMDVYAGREVSGRQVPVSRDDQDAAVDEGRHGV